MPTGTQFSDHDSAVAHGLGERLGRFARALTVLLVVFTVFGLVVSVLEEEPLRLFTTSSGGAQLFLVAVAAGTWAFARRATSFAVRVLDGFFPFAVGVAVAVVLWGSPHSDAPDLLALLLVTLVLLARSALVPSSASTTVGVGVLAFGPTIVATARGFGQVDQAALEPVRVVFVAVWSIGAVIVAAMCSHIVYDLRSRVLEALRLGPYKLGRRLGQGGMGQVFEAEHARLRRPAAIKLLRGDIVSERALSRFEQEVQITATLRHPNIVSVYDFGRTPTGSFFYVMELLEGMSLHQLVLRHGPLPPARVIFLLRQVVGALREAHTQGLVHRDIKPANIMVEQRAGLGDFVKVVDFGLAHPVVDAPSRALVMGTPHFLAPEAIHGLSSVDARADLYAVGVTAYFALTGSYPFDGESVAEICAGHLRDEPVPPSLRAAELVDDDVEALVLRCLEKDPAHRFESAEQLLAALRAAKTQSSWSYEIGRAWWELNPVPPEDALDETASSESVPTTRTIQVAPLAPV